ncbi:MAG: histidinol-phosphatase [Firmicutes bacterium]|nr:histidinol-phosphatase [Bacillota bacterium]
MLVDYHLHTVYSRHAVGSIEAYLARAKALEMEEVCFAEHSPRPFLPEKVQETIPYKWMRDHELEGYLTDVAEAAKKTPIRVRRGLEVDYFPGYDEAVGEFLTGLPLDFALGTVHFMPSHDMQYITLIEEAPVTLLLEYFEYARQAVESGLFDSLAHIHLVWQAVPWPEGGSEELAVEEALAEVVAAARAQDMCLEINTRAFNFEGFGSREVYQKYISLLADYGVPITLGSDAHAVDQIGRNYPEIIRELHHHGIHEVAVFEKRERRMVPLGRKTTKVAVGR